MLLHAIVYYMYKRSCCLFDGLENDLDFVAQIAIIYDTNIQYPRFLRNELDMNTNTVNDGFSLR